MRNLSKKEPIKLHRGGILLSTSSGNIQFGIPPETIKDTMLLEGGVPFIFIVPRYLFNIEKGISLADLEFPIYFNYFIREQKTRAICTEKQRKRLEIVLQEALFGPKKLNIINEFIEGKATPGYPDLRKEMNYFRNLSEKSGHLMQISDLIEFITFDCDGKAEFDDIEIYIDSQREFHIFDNAEEIAIIPSDIHFPPPKVNINEQKTPFYPPLFGITTLGASHGFDPDANTSGMIIWTNRRGTVIDPPVNSFENLIGLGVNSKLVDNVILTHCHADHDAGTLQKLLEEGKVNLYTTRTIFDSFMRKSAALTDLDIETLLKLIHFYPVQIGISTLINGGEFNFNYNLHSIPTISVRVKFRDKSMVYSSDTLDEPESINKIYEKGIINENRRDFLINFPWHHTIVFHEAGIPPIHTPLEYLCSLPKDIREHIYLVHVDLERIPEESGLRIAPIGLANTVNLDVSPLPYDEAIEILDVLAHVDLMRDFPLEKARELLTIIHKEHYKAGDCIFREGDPGNKFYVIMNGKAEIVANEQIVTTYSNSDYFGEKSLILDYPRTASARAKTDLSLLYINRNDLISFVRGTELDRVLTHLASLQHQGLWELLNTSRIFARLTSTQKTQLHTLMKPITFFADEIIIKENTSNDYSYIIRNGNVDVYQDEIFIVTLQKGDFVGVRSIFNENSLSDFTFVAQDRVKLYKIERLAMLSYLKKNPGVYIKLLYYDYNKLAKI